MEQLTIFISGKVTGEDRSHCIAKFDHAQKMLEAEGYKVINPLVIVPENSQWDDAMHICLDALSQADGMLQLPCWGNSEGAKMENNDAIEHGIEIVPLMAFANGRRFSIVRHCACSVDETGGSSQVECCNVCGKPLKGQQWN